MVFAVTTQSLTYTNVKQLSNNAVCDQWSNHNHGRCLNSAKQMTKCIVQYDERQPEKKYCAQSCGILKFVGKEYTLQRVSHRTNFSTQNDVKALQKVFRNTFEKYTLLVYIEVRMQRETNTFSILSRVMYKYLQIPGISTLDVLGRCHRIEKGHLTNRCCCHYLYLERVPTTPIREDEQQ